MYENLTGLLTQTPNLLGLRTRYFFIFSFEVLIVCITTTNSTVTLCDKAILP